VPGFSLTCSASLALPAIAFAAIGTARQRCTSLRRLFIHRTVYDAFVARLKQVYASVRIGKSGLEGTRRAGAGGEREIARVRFVSLSPPNKRSLCRGGTSIGGQS
jgi:acyl-CoA reductase-like NAD-dependent aldehyde dehydrogenase